MRFERLVLVFGTVSALGFASAAEAIDPLDAIGVCSRMSKKESRLDCYDQVARDAAAGRLTGSTSSAQGWAAAPVGGAPTREQAAPAANLGGGVQGTGSVAQEAEGPDEMRVEVASATDNGLGQWRVRLADGAIWQMTESSSNYRPPAPKEVITIRKGALGSFLMDVGSQTSVRVRRVR